jgi:putative transposase
LPVLYLRGVSTGDFQEALAALLGKDAPNLSPAVISRLTAEWQADYDAWQKRDLSARRYVYVWADGVYLQARMEEDPECMLVLIGATPEGKKELVGFQTGVREGPQSWRELLIDIKQRGLEIAPDLAVGDGALGFWKAIEEVFPSTRHQRCWVHKTANVLNKVALAVQVNMKVDLREIYAAPTRAAAETAIDVFADKSRKKSCGYSAWVVISTHLPPPVITDSTAVRAATTHILCCSCGIYFSAAASSETTMAA